MAEINVETPLESEALRRIVDIAANIAFAKFPGCVGVDEVTRDELRKCFDILGVSIL